ncbi:MAG: hypothetical protein GWP05_03795 [Anaerolineaceae bacterium]|nr:hypothetical protein [Anaerolineaceae bacterium]
MPPLVLGTEPTYFDWLVFIAQAVGLGAIIFTLRKRNSANFVSAYGAIMQDLQEDCCAKGRKLLRRFQELSPAEPLPKNKWAKPTGWLDTNKDGMSESETLIYYAKAAYRQFDIAAIVVWHSRIPHLLSTFVAEYQDSIIACWEQGVSIFEDRVHDKREELFHCFSAIYVMAKHRETVKPAFYPHYSWWERIRLYLPRREIVRRAKAKRDRIASLLVAK